MSGERLDDDAPFPAVAERIAAGNVVGWFQGRMEFGPRALGRWSIVADPRAAQMKHVFNRSIKCRDSFRPSATSVLAEAVGDWFDQDYTSPFMVLVYKTLPEKRGSSPPRATWITPRACRRSSVMPTRATTG